MTEESPRATNVASVSGLSGQLPTEAPTPQGAAEPTALAHPAGRVLIVEDDYFVALSIEEALAQGGFDIAGMAETADQAVLMARTTRPDIVLMDIRLRGGRDGIDAAREILQSLGIPCVFATAHDDPGMRQRGEQEAKPLGWVLKPFSLHTFVATVSAAVTVARQRRAQDGDAPGGGAPGGGAPGAG